MGVRHYYFCGLILVLACSYLSPFFLSFFLKKGVFCLINKPEFKARRGAYMRPLQVSFFFKQGDLFL